MVYVFLLALLRLTGKHQTAQYAPFDLVLLLILSNAVQNSMNAGGCLHSHEVERATIETNGQITVVLKKR